MQQVDLVDLGEYTADNQHGSLKSLLHSIARKPFIGYKQKPKPGTQHFQDIAFPAFHYHLQELPALWFILMVVPDSL